VSCGLDLWMELMLVDAFFFLCLGWNCDSSPMRAFGVSFADAVDWEM